MQDGSNIYPEVERALVDTVSEVSPDPERIDGVVRELAARLGTPVYAQLLYLLCHLDFPPEEARAHWNEVLRHRQDLSHRWGHQIDFRVALLDYFIAVNHRIKNPKIIEISIFQKTQDCAMRDELTSLFNSRYFRHELDREIDKALRHRTPLSLVIFDVDYFKWYNDANGHMAGDQVLRGVARILQEEVRASDIAARYGGEEFVVLLPDANKPKALQVADRIRERIAAHPFPFAESQPGGALTVSGGVATLGADARDAAALVEAADRALYLAKGSGKDRVLSAGNESRNFPRVNAALAGTLQVLSDVKHPFLTNNISEQGFQFRCAAPLGEGEYFRFTMTIPEVSQEIEGVARALRVEADGPGAAHTVGAQFVELSYHQAMALRQCLERQTEAAAAQP